MPDAVSKERYSGEYRHKVDSKRRVPVPFRWRPNESEGTVEFTLIVWPRHQAGTFLRVLPPEQMAQLCAEIYAMPNGTPEKSVLKRRIGTSSAHVRLDNVGRIMIPDNMAEEAKITDEAVLAGAMDQFEIWNPERYAQSKVLDEPVFGKALAKME
ncbi:MAG: division/cell wall cluster transcriptional repressor MraZ [Limisphaerales bacterium]